MSAGIGGCKECTVNFCWFTAWVARTERSLCGPSVWNPTVGDKYFTRNIEVIIYVYKSYVSLRIKLCLFYITTLRPCLLYKKKLKARPYEIYLREWFHTNFISSDGGKFQKDRAFSSVVIMLERELFSYPLLIISIWSNGCLWQYGCYYCDSHDHTVSKRKCHFDGIFVTDCTGSCQNDNAVKTTKDKVVKMTTSGASQQWVFRQIDIFVYVGRDSTAFWQKMSSEKISRRCNWSIIQ